MASAGEGKREKICVFFGCSVVLSGFLRLVGASTGRETESPLASMGPLMERL